MQQTLSDGEVTVLLKDWQAGDVEALGRVIGYVYSDLRRLAATFFKKERPDHTLQPTALVHEVYAKLFQVKPQLEGRSHFISFACLIMRRLLLKHARARNAQKRDAARVDVPEMQNIYPNPETLLGVHETLAQLSESDPRMVKIVEMRFFLGLTMEEIAEYLDLSPRTVKREWAAAKTLMAYTLKADLKAAGEPLAEA